MRSFFEILSIFDWISPTISLVENIINDPTPLQSHSWTFFIPFDEMTKSGWSAWDVEDLLKQHGIKTWGSLLHLNEFHFSVKLEQARWAEFILKRNNIPLSELSQGPPNAKRKTHHGSARHQNFDSDPLSFLNHFLDGENPPFF